MINMTSRQMVPTDSKEAVLIGRVWDPASGGPRVVCVRSEDVFDLTPEVRTVAELMDHENPLELVLNTAATRRWSLAELTEASLDRDRSRPHLLAPIDLQVVKACGVTFVESMIERVIEERCGGDFNRAASTAPRKSARLSPKPSAAAWSPYVQDQSRPGRPSGCWVPKACGHSIWKSG